MNELWLSVLLLILTRYINFEYIDFLWEIFYLKVFLPLMPTKCAYLKEEKEQTFLILFLLVKLLLHRATPVAWGNRKVKSFWLLGVDNLKYFSTNNFLKYKKNNHI